MKRIIQFTLLILMCVFVPSVTLAQDDDEMVPFITNFSGHSAHWSSDSRYFYFETYVPQHRSTVWYRLESESQTLVELEDFLIHPDLSADEIAILDLDEGARLSPDGGLVLFTVNRFPDDGQEHWGPSRLLAIANRATGEVFVTDIDDWVLTRESVRNFHVMWAQDGSSLTIAQPGHSPYVYYYNFFHIQIPDRDDLSSIIVQRFNGSIGNTYYDTLDMYVYPFNALRHLRDVSSSNDRILLLVIQPDDDSPYEVQYLVEWNSVNNNQSRVIHGIHSNPFYSPLSDDVILSWRGATPTSDAGLWAYDMIDEIENLIWESDLELTSYHHSPDGQWLIVRDDNWSMFLVDVLQLLGNAPTAESS